MHYVMLQVYFPFDEMLKSTSRVYTSQMEYNGCNLFRTLFLVHITN